MYDFIPGQYDLHHGEADTFPQRILDGGPGTYADCVDAVEDYTEYEFGRYRGGDCGADAVRSLS